MANRRMIDTRIIGQPRFLDMGKAAQALYLHIVANSDDEGVTVAGTVLRMTNTRKTALQELIENGFVTMLIPDQNIVYTNGWHSFNRVDARYGQPSYYHETLREHFPNIPFVDFKRNSGDNPTSDPREREESIVEESKREEKIVQYSRGDGTGNKDDDPPLPLYKMLNRENPNMFFTEPFPDGGDLQPYVSRWLSEHNTEYMCCLNAVAAKILRMKVWKPETCASMAEKFMELNYGGVIQKWKANKWIEMLEGFVKAEKTKPDYDDWYYSDQERELPFS